jgi:hypothetical protein
MSGEQHLENLKEIRNIMEKSTRFLSLSGLSGIMAGVFALLGAAGAYFRMRNLSNDLYEGLDSMAAVQKDLLLIAGAVLICALGSSYFFTARKAKQAGEIMWNKTSKNILLNLSIPLLAGGFLAFTLLQNNLFIWIAPITLIFYGLACINASHKTVRDIFYLGVTCLILGLINTLFLGYGIVFWSLGFGFAHILYGTVMYYKYDRKS